jgi:hypothetical protein
VIVAPTDVVWIARIALGIAGTVLGFGLLCFGVLVGLFVPTTRNQRDTARNEVRKLRAPPQDEASKRAALKDLLAKNLNVGRELMGSVYVGTDRLKLQGWIDATKELIRESLGVGAAERFVAHEVRGPQPVYAFNPALGADYVNNLLQLVDSLGSKTILPDFEPGEWEVRAGGPQRLIGESLSDELEDLIREGMDVVKELSEPIGPVETDEGVFTYSLNPDETRIDKADAFDQQARELLTARRPSLLYDYAQGANACLHRERDKRAKKDAEMNDEGLSDAAKMRRFADTLHGRPAMYVEAFIEGLVAARNRLN